MKDRYIHIPSKWQTLLADVSQAVLTYFIACFLFLNYFAIWILFFIANTMSITSFTILFGVSTFLITLSSLPVSICVKWLVLGKLQEGDYPLWGSYHIRYWFVKILDDVIRIYYCWLFRGTPLLSWYHRAMGCVIGDRVYVAGNIEGFDLVKIGEGSSININATVRAVKVEDGMIKFRNVYIGKGVTIGIASHVEGGALICDGAVIGPLSAVVRGTVVKPNEEWAGSPAVFQGAVKHDDEGPIQVRSSSCFHMYVDNWLV